MALILRNSVFIHVPKTGGTWVREVCQALIPECRESGPFDEHDHFTIRQFRAAMPDLAGMPSFGFVRHPINWLCSRWAWAVQTKMSERIKCQSDAAGHWLADCWDDELTAFLRKSVELHPGIAGRTYARMLGLSAHEGLLQRTTDSVTHIGRNEHLADDLMAIFDKVGEEFDASKVYSHPMARVAGRHVEVAIDRQLKQRLMDAEHLACRTWNYS